MQTRTVRPSEVLCVFNPGVLDTPGEVPIMRVIAALLLLATAAVGQNHFVYTNDNNTPNTVSAFQVAANGSLSLIAGSPFATGGNGGGSNIDPREIAIVRSGAASFLFAANNGDGTVSAFKINPTSGRLRAVPGSPFLADGPSGGNHSLAGSPDGRFLFATGDSTTVIHVF